MQVSSRVCTAFFCIWSATIALAAAVDSQPSRLEVEEVIVTAERRESALEKTPLAVSVFDQSFLEEGSIRSIQMCWKCAGGSPPRSRSGTTLSRLRSIW